MRNDSRGFTLIEIMVALVIFSVVATVLTRLIITSQRVTTSQVVRANLQSNLRVGSMVVPNELRMLNQADSTDILDVSDTSITYRAMRGYYVLCEAITSGTSIKMTRYLPSAFAFDYRLPAAGDSLFLFYENDTLKMTDDKWHRVKVNSVAASTCGAGAWNTKTALTVTLNAAVPGTLALYLPGAPIRTYEITKLSLMTSGSQKWLGMCVVTSAGACSLEPVVGPLAPTNGFKITRYDSSGTAVTGNTFANRNSLKSLTISFIGVGEQNIARSGSGGIGALYDTLTTVVTLRNVKQN